MQVVELMEDGRTRIRFDTGEEHRYKSSSMHKIISRNQARDDALDGFRDTEESWESGGTKDAPEGRMRHRRADKHHSLVHELNEGHGENAHHHFDAAIGDVLRNHTRGSRHSTRSRDSGSATTPRSGAPELPRATCLETVLDC